MAGPVSLKDEGDCNVVLEHLKGFEKAIEGLLAGNYEYDIELPALYVNEYGQVVSGQIDFLASGETGFCLIDHKTDALNILNVEHISQLASYRSMTGIEERVALGVNFSQAGSLSLILS